MSDTRPCSVVGCELPYRARGFCSGHYARAVRTGEIRLVLPRNTLNLCPTCKLRERPRGRSHCNPCHAKDVRARSAQDPERFRAMCRARYNPKKQRAGRLSKYGLTPDAYAALVAKQSGCCAICKRRDVPLHVDHDHSCCPSNLRSCGKCVRGLLCSSCNNGLGRFSDSPLRLLDAAAYISAAGYNRRRKP